MIPFTVEDGPLAFTPLHRTECAAVGDLQPQMCSDTTGSHMFMMWLDMTTWHENTESPSGDTRQVCISHTNPKCCCTGSHLQILRELIAPQDHAICHPISMPFKLEKKVAIMSP